MSAEVPTRAAVLSADGRNRHVLRRAWGPGPRMLQVLLDPSAAVATTDDPRLRRCFGFARTHGCGGAIVVRLCAWRATDPSEVGRVVDAVGPDNDRPLCAAVG